MGELTKTGYIRIVNKGELTASTYLSYKEFMNRSEEYRKRLKEQVDTGAITLYCGCCAENTLGLKITSNLVVRVKENRQQSLHRDSCPKSILYANWNKDTMQGVSSSEDTQVMFHISLPSVSSSKQTSTKSSGESSSSEPKDPRTGLNDMVVMLNKYAWEIQTYIKKKEIRAAKQTGEVPNWQYKTLDEFIRLMFGVSNQIMVRCRDGVVPFISLCYRKDLFYACDDWRKQWFFYARIDKVSEIKKERKYQYITVLMPSLKSPTKAVIRIETEKFYKLVDGKELTAKNGLYPVLAGYISRSTFSCEDGSVKEWMTLSKGIVLSVDSRGLYVENETVLAVCNCLVKNNVIFSRPYTTLESYGGEVPTFMVEKKHRKNITIDVVNDHYYRKRAGYGEDNDEFECIFIKEKDDLEEQLSAMLEAVLHS